MCMFISWPGNRGRGLAAALLSAMLVAFPLSGLASTNVVVVMVDDLGRDAYDALIQGGWLPNLRSDVIDQGVSFQNKFVTNSQCCPSRATFLTGQYSHNNGVFSNVGPQAVKSGIDWPGWMATADAPGKEGSTIATWLQDAGYHTGFAGKYLNGYGHSAPEGVADPQTYIPPGWAEWNGLLDPTTYKVYDYQMNQNGVVTSYGTAESDYQTDVLSGRAVDFINRAADSDSPFFLLVTPLAPHLELVDPAEFIGPDSGGGLGLTIRPAPRHAHLIDGDAGNGELPDLVMKPSFNEADVSDKPSCPRPAGTEGMVLNFYPHCVADTPLFSASPDIGNLQAQYKSMLASMIAVDDMMGQIIDTLEQKNVLSNTVIIFTSDNGWLSGEHRMIGKELAYEESIRVPLVIRAPGGQAAVESSKIVLNNDLAPTIAAIAGITPPYATDGVSMQPLLTNPDDSSWHRRFFLVERWFVTSLFQYESPTAFSLRRIFGGQDYTFISSHTNPADVVNPTHHEFYDLNSDPYQLSSVTLPAVFNDTFDNFLRYLRRCKGQQCTILEGL